MRVAGVETGCSRQKSRQLPLAARAGVWRVRLDGESLRLPEVGRSSSSNVSGADRSDMSLSLEADPITSEHEERATQGGRDGCARLASRIKPFINLAQFVVRSRERRPRQNEAQLIEFVVCTFGGGGPQLARAESDSALVSRWRHVHIEHDIEKVRAVDSG